MSGPLRATGVRSTVLPDTLQHPHRALPPGKTWLPHDGAGAKARRRRQMARQREKAMRKIVLANTAVLEQAVQQEAFRNPAPVRALRGAIAK